MEKTVGIITLPGRFNYGNRLQNYAVSHLYETLGYSPVTLELKQRPSFVRDAKAMARRMVGREVLHPEDLMSKARLAAFDSFNEHLAMRRLSSLEPTLADEYNWFSTGSDQVWNPDYCVNNDDWYFLEFARPGQRIALAPSIGINNLDAKQARRIARGVRGFQRLSVRERRGAELIKECSGRDAEVICDPTLAVNVSEWRSVANDSLTPTTPYVLTYLLGGLGSEAQAVLNEVTDNGRISVISLSDREKPEEPPAGPAEFISLVDNATHVVTDSFHGAVFSSILQTPLTIVHREGDTSMFSRLETLSIMLGIEHKVAGDSAFNFARAGDYAGVSEAIDVQQRHFMAYLKECLSG